MPLLLDTTVLIDVLRDRPAAARLRALVEAGEVPFVCTVSVEELMRGIRPDEVTRAATWLLYLRPAPLGIHEGALAGSWRREYAQRGITLHQSDCLIAASAVAAHATVATGNTKDFPMEGVAVEHWPVGT